MQDQASYSSREGLLRPGQDRGRYRILERGVGGTESGKLFNYFFKIHLGSQVIVLPLPTKNQRNKV